MERKAKAGKNTRKKQKEQASAEPEEGTGASLLKKNELTIIFVGAGILTAIIFFIFFNPSGANRDKNTAVHEIPSASNADLTQLQKRIDRLETVIKERSAAGQAESAEGSTGRVSEKNLDGESLDSYRNRVERIETALSVKMEAVNKRIDSLEKNMSGLSDKLSSISSPPGSNGSGKEKKVSKDIKKKSMFHTVQKGDTLYSISRKYDTSVENLRKINNLDEDSAIYPGDNLVIE